MPVTYRRRFIGVSFSLPLMPVTWRCGFICYVLGNSLTNPLFQMFKQIAFTCFSIFVPNVQTDRFNLFPYWYQFYGGVSPSKPSVQIETQQRRGFGCIDKWITNCKSLMFQCSFFEKSFWNKEEIRTPKIGVIFFYFCLVLFSYLYSY